MPFDIKPNFAEQYRDKALGSYLGTLAVKEIQAQHELALDIAMQATKVEVKSERCRCGRRECERIHRRVRECQE